MNTTVRSAPSRPAALLPTPRHGAITAVVCVALAAVVAAMSSLSDFWCSVPAWEPR